MNKIKNEILKNNLQHLENLPKRIYKLYDLMHDIAIEDFVDLIKSGKKLLDSEINELIEKLEKMQDFVAGADLNIGNILDGIYEIEEKE